MNLTIEQLKDDFVRLTEGWSWEIQGFIDQNGAVYPIDSDTKVISTVFERLSSPVLRSIANLHGYVVETANQTTYPDFTMSKFDMFGNLVHRIAIDIKTTYYGGNRNMGFTLGSYTSFLRNDTKNILHPYPSYNDHWVLGFIYSRNDAFEEYDLSNIPQVGQIQCPYDLQGIFIREKIAIAGLRAGSGNTANIGSVKSRTPADFGTVNGPFTQFRRSHDAFRHYWSRYEHYNAQIVTAANLYEHPDFFQYR